MAKAAHSAAVIDWFSDEQNESKRILAFEELSGIVDELYGSNLYVGVETSCNEYSISQDIIPSNIRTLKTLSRDDPEDLWYFECVETDKDYILSINIDHVLNKKRVWLDYKVVNGNTVLGVICTGLEFSNLLSDLFSHYSSSNMRGLIIDGNGIIDMDSAHLDNQGLLSQNIGMKIEDEFSDNSFLTALRNYIGGIDGYFMKMSAPDVIEMSTGIYRYATIAPITGTNWSVITLTGTSSLLDMSVFLPMAAFMLILLAAFAIITSTSAYRLIFRPLEHLIQSLAWLKENKGERIYGIDRDDEFGSLSNTILDLFTKANHDALTGVYNRRYMENSLIRVMDSLSRADGKLSVLMIDVDYFKKYNDSFGHDQGDACLKSVAQALSASITRMGDFAARYGGEEFIAVLPSTDKAGAMLIANKLLDNIRSLKIPHPHNEAAEYVTVSAGVTSGNVKYTQNWEEYIKRADEALYMSKNNGRNQFTYLDFPDS
jgi:diguanylate cyclase (GGDEF)-like protein